MTLTTLTTLTTRLRTLRPGRHAVRRVGILAAGCSR